MNDNDFKIFRMLRATGAMVSIMFLGFLTAALVLFDGWHGPLMFYLGGWLSLSFINIGNALVRKSGMGFVLATLVVNLVGWWLMAIIGVWVSREHARIPFAIFVISLIAAIILT